MALRTIGQLAGQAQFARRGFAGEVFGLIGAYAFFGLEDQMIEQGFAAGGIGDQPMIEMVFDGLIDQTRCFGGGEFFFGLALELRVFDEQRQQHGGVAKGFVAGNGCGAAVADQLAIGAKPAQ